MSLRFNAFLLVLLTVVIAVVGIWNRDALFSGAWYFPAALLFMGLAYESWVVSRSALTVKIELAPQYYLGRPMPMRLALTHSLARPLRVEIAPQAPDYVTMDSTIAEIVIPEAKAGGCERKISAGRLGSFEWPQQSARIAGPLGLAWWSKALPCDAKISIVPDLYRSTPEARSLKAPGLNAAADFGAGAEVLRLREYRAGDPPRLVDWKATARAGRLISRDFVRDSGLQIVIVVDAGRAGALRAGTLDRFGHYVNVAARLAQFAVDREDLVGLVVYADRPLAAIAPGRGVAAVSRLRAVLAATRIESTESNPLFAVTRVRSLVRHRSLVVMLTDFDDASSHSQLAQAARFLLPTHLPFIAGLSSAAAEDMANAPSHHWLDPYKALAAQEYCTGLERKVRAINAMGAPALATRPEQLERAVLSAYAQFSQRRRA